MLSLAPANHRNRYKDARPVVRECSLAALGDWIGAYQARLLDDHYLKYLG